jgi:hypothetical protein
MPEHSCRNLTNKTPKPCHVPNTFRAAYQTLTRRFVLVSERHWSNLGDNDDEFLSGKWTDETLTVLDIAQDC